jgi:hypothetical protein
MWGAAPTPAGSSRVGGQPFQLVSALVYGLATMDWGGIRGLRAGRAALATFGFVAAACVWGAPIAAAAPPPLIWSAPVAIDSGAVIKGVSCPSVSLCVAVDNHGNILTTTEPTGGAGAWTSVNVTETAGFIALTCPSTSLCVALDGAGEVWTSTNPAGGAKAWSPANVTEGLGFGGSATVSCASTSLCVIAPDAETVHEAKNVAFLYVSANPTGGVGAWSRTVGVDEFGHAVAGMACISAPLCVGAGAGGDVVTSTNPTGGAAKWTAANVDGERNLFGVACPSTLMCVAVDIEGDVVTTSNPTGGALAWTSTNVDGANTLYAVSCPSVSLCVAVDDQSHVIASTEPLAGAGVWTVTKVEEGFGSLDAISCPSTTLCVAVDVGGNAVIGTSPAGPAQKLVVTLGGTGVGGVSGPGINCSNTSNECTGSYPEGAEVTLHATPSPGSTFGGWLGACSGAEACTLKMTTTRVTTAVFNKIVVPPGTGTSPGGLKVPSGGAPAGGYPAGTERPLRTHPLRATKILDPLIQGVEVTQGVQASNGSNDFFGKFVGAERVGPACVSAGTVELKPGPPPASSGRAGPVFCYPEYPGDGLPFPSAPLGPAGLIAEYHGVPLAVQSPTFARVWVADRLLAHGTEASPPVTLHAEIDGVSFGNGIVVPPAALQPTLVAQPSTIPHASTAFVSGRRQEPGSAYVFLLPATLSTQLAQVHGTSLKLVAHVTPPASEAEGECAEAACSQNDTFTLGGIGPWRTAARLIIQTVGLEAVSYVRTSKTGPPVPHFAPLIPEKALGPMRQMFPGGPNYIVRPPSGLPINTAAIDGLQFKEGKVFDAAGNPSEACGETLPPNFSLGTCQAQLYGSAARQWVTENPGYASGEVPGVRETARYDVMLGLQPGSVNRSWSSGGDINQLPTGTAPYAQVNELRPFGGVAHEFGHKLSLIHAGPKENCGKVTEQNEKETEFLSGAIEWWPPDDKGQLQSYGFEASPGIASLGPGGPPGFNFKVFTPTEYDVMSYCAGEANAWLSAENWTVTLQALAAYEERLAAIGIASSTSSHSGGLAQAASSTAGAGQLMVFGLLDGAGAAITRVQPLPPGTTIRGSSPGLSLRALDASGAVEGETPLELEHIHRDGGDPSPIFTALAPGTAQRVEVVSGGRVIASMSRPPHAPSVRLLSPSRRTRAGARGLLVTWRAADVDGKRLTATVAVSANDGRTWRTAAQDLEGTSVVVPATMLPSTRHGRVRVQVSDGFNETTALSARLRFPGSAPQLTITQLVPGHAISSDESAQLSAQAIDETGRPLSGGALRWYDAARAVGSGTSVVLTGLAPGVHRIRLVARGHTGRVAQASLRLSVSAAAPQVTLAEVPASVPRNARTLTAVLAANEPALVRVGGHRLRIGPTARRVTIALSGRGGSVAQASLALSAYGRHGLYLVAVRRR